MQHITPENVIEMFQVKMIDVNEARELMKRIDPKASFLTTEIPLNE